MPLFYQHNINDFTKLAIWRIAEAEEFFLKKVNVQNSITHPHKRLQHLAGRYLLQLLEPDFPLHLISIAHSKKPSLSNEAFHFSISHCGDFAAVIISENHLVGIDVELINPKIEIIQHKFLGTKERELINNFHSIHQHSKLLTLFWSSKEAIFKWYGKGSVDFKKNMIIDYLFFEDEKGFVDARFIKEKCTPLKIGYKFFENLCLAWVVK